MKRGHQWIHMDAQFPLGLGHDLAERFGAAGELLFVLFLLGCKRSYPQGHIRYRTEEELRILLWAHFDFVDNAGDKWSLEEFWQWCGRRKVTSRRVRGGRTHVTATRWKAWEDDSYSSGRERKRRSRANSVTGHSDKRLEVGEGRLEVGGGSARGERRAPQQAGPALNELINRLEPKTKRNTANG